MESVVAVGRWDTAPGSVGATAMTAAAQEPYARSHSVVGIGFWGSFPVPLRTLRPALSAKRLR